MSDLCPLDLYNHSLTGLLMNYTINNITLGNMLKDKVVCHIGSHDAIEFGIYKHFGVKGAEYFECNKYVYPNLLQRLGNEPGHNAHLACLWSETGKELEFHFYRNIKDGAGSLYENDKFESYVPDCPMLNDSVKVRTNTFDNFVNDGIVSIENMVFLNLDVQGAELEVLKGAKTLLSSESLRFIWCEVSWDNLYKGGAQKDEITEYLSKFNFQLYGVRQDGPNMPQGDALYVR